VQTLREAASAQQRDHTAALAQLQAALDAASQSGKQQAAALQAVVAQLREDAAAAQRSRAAESEAARAAAAAAQERLQQDVARRTRTILSLSADNEGLRQAQVTSM
jgi:hypothetical protein